jgi:hypothetical protein
MSRLSTQELRDLQHTLSRLCEPDDDYVIVSVGTHGPNIEFRNGNPVATVRIGDEEATAEGKYLDVAITLARAKCRDAKAAKVKAAEKKKESAV